MRGEVLSLTVELPQSCELREFLKIRQRSLADRTRSEESAYATAVCGARTTGPHRRVPERDFCAILTIGVLPVRPAPDQHQRRLPPCQRQPAGAVETVTLSIYADQEGGAPLWQETQTIALDGQGRYALLLGATQADGIPAAVFGSGEAKWLGTVFERAGEVEGPRVRITSVPYALRASDADTLGGRPASDYLLAPAAGAGRRQRAAPPSRRRPARAPTSCCPARRTSSPST